jgi:hypothetical protein
MSDQVGITTENCGEFSRARSGDEGAAANNANERLHNDDDVDNAVDNAPRMNSRSARGRRRTCIGRADESSGRGRRRPGAKTGFVEFMNQGGDLGQANGNAVDLTQELDLRQL